MSRKTAAFLTLAFLRREAAAALALGVAAYSLYNAFQPQGDAPGHIFPHADKVLHTAAYGTLAWLTFRALITQSEGAARRMIRVGSGVAALGIVNEGIQWAMGLGRTAEWGDVGANAAGIVAACLLFWRAHTVLDTPESTSGHSTA